MDKKFSYEEFVRIRTIKKLAEVERESYISFYEKVWKEDFETAKRLLKINPRWAVIAGYYAMHNLAKLFLAKKFNLKISGKFVHAATIEALKKFLKERKIIKRFELSIKFVPVEELPELLEAGKRERSKSQYYVGRSLEISSREAYYFFKEILEPFVKSLEKLI